MSDPQYQQYQYLLKKSLTYLSSVNGYSKLETRINAVADWKAYRAISAQIDVTRWFKNQYILKEIEPTLPHRNGFTDILISFSDQDIYCEVYSLESFFKSLEPIKQEKERQKLIKKQQEQSPLPELEIEHQIKQAKIIRNILEKTKKQLPINHPGILALETGMSAVFHLEVKEITKRIFINRPNLMLIMLWSSERGSDIGEPPFWFENHESKYQNIGKEFLEYLSAEPLS